MKILFISPRYEGGIGGHAFRVAEKLREQGYDVKLMHVPHVPIKNLKNPSQIEKYAREVYFMKRDSEDIYIIDIEEDRIKDSILEAEKQ